MKTVKKYITTKSQCQEMIDKYNNVCQYCGRKLEPIETVDNANRPTYWIGCNKCLKFNNGTTKRIYDIAVKMVDERNLVPYTHNRRPDKKEEKEKYKYWRECQIGGAVSIVKDILFLNNQLT